MGLKVVIVREDNEESKAFIPGLKIMVNDILFAHIQPNTAEAIAAIEYNMKHYPEEFPPGFKFLLITGEIPSRVAINAVSAAFIGNSIKSFTLKIISVARFSK